MSRSNTPLLAADCVVIDSAGRVLLIRRKCPPYEGALALPGGFVEIGETIEDACRRELLEETSLEVGSPRLVGVYSEPERDPRGHVCSIAFLSQIDRAAAIAGDDAASVEWARDWNRSSLAFDHRKVIGDAVQLAAGHPQA